LISYIRKILNFVYRRRYWIFPTVSGLFVEHDDEFVGSCLPTPTPHIGEVNLNDVKFIQDNFEKVIYSVILIIKETSMTILSIVIFFIAA
jgi:hypothetical protein